MAIEVVKILRAGTREAVDAQLYDDVTPQQLADAEAKWKFLRYQAVLDLLKAGAPRTSIPENWHWDWTAKLARAGAVAVRLFGVECQGEWQGLMMTTTVGFQARVAPNVGEGLVYVKYLESAPWNLKAMTATPRFSAVGVRLMEAAVRESIDLGFGGRVGLHALPNAATFYERCGFVTTGVDAAVEDLPYYELTSVAAIKFLGGTP